MRTVLSATILMACLAIGFATARAESADGKSALADNAALQYWQAFSQLPALGEDEQRVLGAWDTIDLADPAVEKLLNGSQASLLYLHRAAQCKHCDWGLEYDDGIGLLLPHLAKGRDLARVAALHARRELDRGNKKAGRVDATAIMALGRHVGRDPVMICLLVRFGIEGFAVDAAAPYIPDIKAPHAQAVKMFEALPPAPSVRETVAVEKKVFIEWGIKKLRDEETRQKGAGIALWKNFLSGTDVPDSLRNVSIDEAVQHMQNMLPIYDEIGRLAALPKEEFDAQYPAFKKQAKADNPLAGFLVPAVDELLAKEQRHQARLAMLLAATAVVEGGPDKLNDIRDPFGSGPFEYRKLDGSAFELKSKLLYEGQPVVLVVGRK